MLVDGEVVCKTELVSVLSMCCRRYENISNESVLPGLRSGYKGYIVTGPGNREPGER